MITAIDTNVLLDVFTADKRFGEASRDAVRRAHAEGKLIACEVVWAEIAGAFPSPDEAAKQLAILGVSFRPLNEQHALAAGDKWRKYRQAGGPRTRVVADFLVGAHGAGSADRLLTRDRGFYRNYFDELVVFEPG